MTYEQRLAVVRGHYDSAYPDPKKKFEAFKGDKVALKYLGELYAPLYELYSFRRNREEAARRIGEIVSA